MQWLFSSKAGNTVASGRHKKIHFDLQGVLMWLFCLVQPCEVDEEGSNGEQGSVYLSGGEEGHSSMQKHRLRAREIA